MRRNHRLEVKTADQVARMREAGLVVGSTLETLREAVRPGISTAELNRIAEDRIRSQDAVPSFLGYHGFPGSICVSVNDEIVHGIPGERVLEDGDLVSIDCGAILAGWHGDAAITVPVGSVAPELLELSRACEHALWSGLAKAVPGGRLSDISAAVEAGARAARPSAGIVAEYVGHGIGREMHQPPEVPNLGRAGRGPRLRPGATLAVEPMLTLGSPDNDVLDDDWTVVTVDGSRAVHWEHTVAVTADGPSVLTALDGGESGFAQLEGGATPRA